MPDDRLQRPASPPAPGIVDRFLQTMRDARRLAYDHLELAALEAQRAADGLVRILCGAIVISVLIVTAWMSLVAAAAFLAMREGLSPPGAMLVVAAANLVVALGIGMWIRSRMPELMFTATLRQLRLAAGEEEGSDEDRTRG